MDTLIMRRVFAFLTLPVLLIASQPLPSYAQVQEDVYISALIPAKSSDYTVSLTETSQTGAVVRPNTGMDFTVSYGSALNHQSPITVEAEWSLGTVSGDAAPSVPILRFKHASNGYNFTPPVVDLTNRKITWTLQNFPGETESQVTFSLETVNTYTLDTAVGFSVSARVLGIETATPDRTILKTFRNSPDTNSSSSAPGPSATPTPLPPVLFLDRVVIQTIATNSASILVTTSLPSTLRVSYGTAPRLLTKHLTSPRATRHIIQLPALLTDKLYYFQIAATDTNGKTITSVMYSLKTAAAPPEVLIDPDTILLRVGDVTLHFPGSDISPEAIAAVVPVKTVFQLQTRQEHSEKLKSLVLDLKNASVLGVDAADGATISSNGMVALQPGIFAGKLRALVPGTYLIVLQVTERNGNISEHTIARVKVVPPLRILAAGTHEPVENAKISIAKYDPVTRLHTLIPEQSGINNPAITDHTGTAAIVLPNGQYRIAVRALGFVPEEVNFTIGSAEDQTYPTVQLTKEPFSAFTVLHFMRDAINDLYGRIEQFARSLAVSSRYFTLVTVLIIGCFVLLTFLAFTARTRIPLHLIPGFLFHHILIHRSKHAVVRGTIHDLVNKKPIKHVRVALIDAGNGNIQTQTTTDRTGAFSLRVLANHGYRISMIKNGYHPLEQVVHASSEPVVISLTQTSGYSIVHALTHMVGMALSFLFEALLVLSIILEIAFASVRGIGYVLPFLVLSILNAVLWIFYIYNERWKRA